MPAISCGGWWTGEEGGGANEKGGVRLENRERHRFVVEEQRLMIEGRWRRKANCAGERRCELMEFCDERQ